jgi:hypothetical protein
MNTTLVPTLPGAFFRDGRWFAAFVDHQGHRRQLGTRARTRAEAQRMAERLHAQEAAIRQVLVADAVALNKRARQ